MSQSPNFAIQNKTVWVAALAILLVSAQDHAAADTTNHAKVFLTGDEQTIINRFTQETDRPVSGSFSNDLDHALALLAVKTYPKPDVTRLARATIASLAEEFARETGGQIGPAQQDTYASTASQTKRFDSILKSLVALGPTQTDQRRLIEAGLNGMLKASGWDAACVLPEVQAKEFKRLIKTRETATEERGVIGLNLDRWPVAHVVPGAPAAEAGVRNGDVVVAVNGKDVAEAKTAEDALKILHGPPGGMVKLAVKRGGGILTFDVTRASAAAAMVKAQQVETNALLITIPTFEGSGIAAAVKRFIDKRAANRESVVILDLRNNGGGRPEEANAVADMFLDSKVLQIFEFRNGTRIAFNSNPGAVAARVILLMNKQTGSAAEMLAMALHDNSRATLVGERTAGALFGKALPELTNGRMIIFRTEPTVLSPEGRDYSITGIPPEVEVRDASSKERDAILNRALELARAKVKN